MFWKSHRSAISLLLLCASIGCSSVDRGQQQWVVIDVDPTDALDSTLTDGDAALPDSDADLDGPRTPDVDADTEDAGRDTQDAGDDEGPALLHAYDPALWEQDNACEGVVTYPPVDEAFFIPENVGTARPSVGRDLQRYLSSGLSVSAVLPSVPYQVKEKMAFNLYSQDDEDITLHLAVAYNPEFVKRLYGYDSFDDHLAVVTLMVDYEPVEASYVVWNDDRSVELERFSGTGGRFDAGSNVVLVDITVPADALPERRRYELSVSLYFGVPGHLYGETTRRFALYNGGFDRPSHRCFEPALYEPFTVAELEGVSKATGMARFMLFPEGVTNPNRLKRPIPAAPGETVRIYASIAGGDARERALVGVPTLNGVPVGEPVYVTMGLHGGDYGRQINGRKFFDVTLPDTPGTYDVTVAAWEDAFVDAVNREGERDYAIRIGQGIANTPNTLRFVVSNDGTVE